MLDPSVEGCRKALADGIAMFCIGVDIMMFRPIAEQAVAQLNEAVVETGYRHRPAPESAFNR